MNFFDLGPVRSHCDGKKEFGICKKNEKFVITKHANFLCNQKRQLKEL